MDESMDTPAAQAPAVQIPGLPTREYRATMTFTIAAAFLFVALLIVMTQAGYVGGSGGAILSAALAIATAAVEAWGLSNLRDWARYAMTPLLWIYVVAGTLVFVIALSRNSINIPIGAILAGWALLAKPSEALGPLPAASTEGMVLVVAAVVSALIQFL